MTFVISKKSWDLFKTLEIAGLVESAFIPYFRFAKKLIISFEYIMFDYNEILKYYFICFDNDLQEVRNTLTNVMSNNRG